MEYDPTESWAAPMEFRRPKLRDSYHYPQWREDIITHLMIFRVASALDDSKAMQKHRQASGKATVKPSEKPENGGSDAITDTAVPTANNQPETRLSEMAQASIYLSLSDDVQSEIMHDFPFPNAAALWDHLYEEYGTPGIADINRAYRELFPPRKWEDGEDIVGNMVKQRRAAAVLSAAGIPVSDALVIISHLRYLPPSFFDSAGILSLTMQKPCELKSNTIISAASKYIENVRPRQRQRRCYFHNTSQHDISECRNVRGLLRKLRRSEGTSKSNKADEEKAISKIFDQTFETKWYCGLHTTEDHDDEWCVEQLKKRLR